MSFPPVDPTSKVLCLGFLMDKENIIQASVVKNLTTDSETPFPNKDNSTKLLSIVVVEAWVLRSIFCRNQ